MTRYVSRSLFPLLLVLLGVSGCALLPQTPPAATSPPSLRPRPFTAVFAALPTSLALHRPYGWHQAQILPLLYDGLTVLDKDLHPQPALATRWDISPDGLVYTLHLRRRVQFHHGKELEAADVRHSFTQAAATPVVMQEERMPFAVISAIETPDRHTVRFVLKEPYAPFLSKLTVMDCPIVARGPTPSSHLAPPGTGPFHVTSFQPGRSITLQKFPSYWEHGSPRMNTLILRAVASATTRLQLIHNGEADFALLDPVPLPRSFAAVNATWEVVHSAPTGVFSVIFNTRRQPFADVKVRRAFAQMIDRSALAHHVLGEYGVPVAQPFPEATTPWHTAETNHTFDINQARTLLEQAGHRDGLRVTLLVVTGVALFDQTAVALQEQLRRAGLQLHIEAAPADAILDRVQRGDWDLLLRGEASQVDPDDVYFTAFHSSRTSTSNVSGYHNAILDSLLTAGRLTRERHERQQTYQQVVAKLHQDIPELYLFMARWPVAWHQRVRGYDADLLRCCLLRTVTAIANQGFKTIWLQE